MKILIMLLCMVFLSISPYSSFAAEKGADECVEPPTITVTGTAYEEHEPDTAVLSVAVETTSLIAAKAAEENARMSDDLVREIKKLIGPGDSIKTSSYTITPIYRSKVIRRADEYRVTNQVTVTTRKVKDIGRIIDRAVESGSNRISGMRFKLSDYSGYCKNVLDEASKKASSMASSVVKNFNVRIKGVKSIRPSCGPETGPPVGFAIYREAASTPVEPGSLKVYGTVDVEFYVGE